MSMIFLLFYFFGLVLFHLFHFLFSFGGFFELVVAKGEFYELYGGGWGGYKSEGRGNELL